MDAIFRLAALEDIRQLKARYFRGVDSKNAELLRSVFTSDAETDFRSESPTRDPALLQRDPDVFVRSTLSLLEGIVSVHAGSMPEITLLSADEAEGSWFMSDKLWVEDPARAKLPFRSLQGWGIYHDRYRRTAAGWRIAATRLERIKVVVSQE